MQYRTLGRTGLQVSEIGVGGAQFGLTNYMGRWDAFSDEAQRMTTATIHRALELDYTYFDTAPGYGDGRSELDAIVGLTQAHAKGGERLHVAARAVGQDGDRHRAQGRSMSNCAVGEV
jgi:aryl-alcohol dehydrogenase-like predicted oxidoreductase